MESLYAQAQKQDNAVVLIYIRPIIMTTNRYELTSISGWDGSRLYVDQQNEVYLYAPQVGAGRKNRDGSFTGMVMGRRNVRSGADEAVGLFGYSSGAQTIFLDADTGAAYFGINNEIILDPRPEYTSTIAGWGLGADKIESKGILNEQGKSYKVGLYTPNKIINDNGSLIFEHAFTSGNSIHPIAFGAEYDGNYAYITYDGHFYSNKGEIKGSKIVDSTLEGTTKIDAEIDSLFTIKKLEEKGYIKKNDNKNRILEILVPNEYLQQDENVIDVPLLGKVTAGTPIEAIETPDEYFSLPANLVTNKSEVFTLKVSGESMINVGIYDGDIIIVERKNTATNGETVVAMNEDNEATVKTFYKENGYFRLQPENDTMEPIILKEVTILGKVIGLYRKF